MNIFEPTHLIILFVVVLLLFGGKKIPELMRGAGQGVGEFKKGIEESKRVLSQAMTEEPKPADPATASQAAAANPPAAAPTTPPKAG